ncbi:MAG: hypothetical protein ACE5IZ_04225 [Dehalococcoidia bacterium]
MDAKNRLAIVALATLWVGFMAFIIVIAWLADAQAIDRLGDFVRYLDDHTDNQSKVIVTLGALALILVALVVITVEVLPPPVSDIRLVQAGGVTAVLSGASVAERLGEELRALPQVREASAQVFGRHNGMAVVAELAVAPDANLAATVEAAQRLVQEVAEGRIGVPLVASPMVRVRFASGPAAPPAVAADGEG